MSQISTINKNTTVDKDGVLWDSEQRQGLLLNKNGIIDKAKFRYADTTKNYASFSYHPQNRALIPRKIKVIARSIERFGNCGMVLTRDSIIAKSKKEVFDGQHTLEACKLLKVPVNYAHYDNVPLRAMIELNKNTTAWKLPDYLQFGVGEGISDYKLLNRYFIKYNQPKAIKISSLICLFSGSQSSQVFKGMAFKATRPEYADIVLSYLKDFSDYIEHWNHTKFIWAMCRVVDTGKYSHGHMMYKVQMASDRFRNASGVEGHKQAIEDMYNFRCTKNNLVRFV